MDSEEDYIIAGFPTKELAIEFARRWVRDSVEDLRVQSTDQKADVKKMWRTFGEDALVIDGNYRGSSELEFFIENPAIKEEIDWREIKRIAGMD